MIEYFSFFLQCDTAVILGATVITFTPFLKMAEASINDVLPEVPYDPPKSDVKQQNLIKCVLTGSSKQYLGKAYTEEQINKLGAEEVDKLFRNYQAKLSDQMVMSLSKSIINMYSMGACAVLGMTNQDALSKDLESCPFLNSALQRVHLRTVLQIRFFPSTSKRRNIYSLKSDLSKDT